ncbi:MAG: DGQHR domain-containing protein [Chloroflexota bacterium]|jgi:DNA sulfur modification protein DndB
MPIGDAFTIVPNVARREISHPETGVKRYYYSGTISSDMVRLLTFVPVREESKKSYLAEVTDGGYQRPGSATRMRLFGDFVRQNPLSVVPPVMLSGRGKWTFDEASQSLQVYAPAAIIDGQHRVGGYAYLFDEDQIPRSIEFILLPDLDPKEEVDEFLTINTTQKGVPKSLNVLLAGVFDGSEDALVALELDNRQDSPFFNKITQVQRTKGDLFSLAAVQKSVTRTFDHGVFEGIDLDQKVDIMFRYWTLIADNFPEEWDDISKDPKDHEFKLLETTGLIAWSLAAKDILAPAYEMETRSVNWERVERQIQKLSIQGALDWRKNGEFQGVAGEVGGRRICKKMQQILAMHASRDDED